MVTMVQQIEGLSKRLEKARQLVTDGKIQPVLGMESHYVVESSKGDRFYLGNGECTCPDARQRVEVHNGWCKHNLAAELFKEAQGATQEARVKEDVESLYGPQDEEKK